MPSGTPSRPRKAPFSSRLFPPCLNAQHLTDLGDVSPGNPGRRAVLQRYAYGAGQAQVKAPDLARLMISECDMRTKRDGPACFPARRAAGALHIRPPPYSHTPCRRRHKRAKYAPGSITVAWPSRNPMSILGASSFSSNAAISPVIRSVWTTILGSVQAGSIWMSMRTFLSPFRIQYRRLRPCRAILSIQPVVSASQMACMEKCPARNQSSSRALDAFFS